MGKSDIHGERIPLTSSSLERHVGYMSAWAIQSGLLALCKTSSNSAARELFPGLKIACALLSLPGRRQRRPARTVWTAQAFGTYPGSPV